MSFVKMPTVKMPTVNIVATLMYRPEIPFFIFQLGVTLAVMATGSWIYQQQLAYCYLTGINLATFITMGTDKLQAQRNKLRVPESVIFLSALIGGIGGVYAGIWVFRHKTQKPRFIFYLILITFLQILLATNCYDLFV